MQTTPRAFQLLILIMVDDFVDLRRQLAVNLGDHRLKRQKHIVRNQRCIGQRLFGQGRNGGFDCGFCIFRARLEFLFKQTGKVGFGRFRGARGTFYCCCFFSHALLLAFIVRRCGLRSQLLQKFGVVHRFGNQRLSARLAVHIRHQVGQFVARIQQLFQRLDLLRNRTR